MSRLQIADWLRASKATLKRQDALEALDAIEHLRAWLTARADEAIDLACIETILAGKHDPKLDAQVARRRLQLHHTGDADAKVRG